MHWTVANAPSRGALQCKALPDNMFRKPLARFCCVPQMTFRGHAIVPIEQYALDGCQRVFLSGFAMQSLSRQRVQETSGQILLCTSDEVQGNCNFPHRATCTGRLPTRCLEGLCNAKPFVNDVIRKSMARLYCVPLMRFRGNSVFPIEQNVLDGHQRIV